jgi:phage-related protein
MTGLERPVIWVGSSRRDLRAFPREVRRDIGMALYTGTARGYRSGGKTSEGIWRWLSS